MATQTARAQQINTMHRPADDWLESSKIGVILDDLFGTMLPEQPTEDAAR